MESEEKAEQVSDINEEKEVDENDGNEILDDSVAKLIAVEAGNALKILQNFYLFNEKENEL